ncbi:hypothetical protein CO026_03580 [Candidatus Kaiserbacteria bacterium CG_4_9_14_0_2_um_filter_41_32]|uniref:VTT domain-containing protein n=1 Tax=Candidatus Kaiserbacteria bacterium CG_4_9_14_0_2_um_filter_41_32 TaxID=1974601 RepID=A0A2M8FE17_9BACT|nr:MAG: hypothetical protein CO026_03580 [Candidatus Kaiserbacteria bacterium CG_4_9_14_0_2_um_filter_41_32]
MSESLFTKFTRKIEHLLQTKYSLWGIGLISFFESALVIPIVTDPFMMAYILANRSKTILIIIVTIFSSLAGGMVAYLMAVFFSNLTLSLLSPDLLIQFNQISENFRGQTFILTIIGAITPIPYTLVALAAGFIKGSFWWFVLGTIVGRTIRYATVGYITYHIGNRAIKHWRKNILILSLFTVIAISIYFLFEIY